MHHAKSATTIAATGSPTPNAVWSLCRSPGLEAALLVFAGAKLVDIADGLDVVVAADVRDPVVLLAAVIAGFVVAADTVLVLSAGGSSLIS